MRVMAFDIATTTGVAFGIVGGTPRCTTIDFGKAQDHNLRFAKAIKTARFLIWKYKPDLIAYEAPIGGSNTSHVLVGLAACIGGQIQLSGKPAHKVHVASIRKHFLGKHVTTAHFPNMKHAHAKTEIKKMVVRRCHQIGWKVRCDDEADAAALWDYACATFCKGQSRPVGGLFDE